MLQFTPPDVSDDTMETASTDTGKSWVRLAQEAYSISTSYVDTNYRRKWEDNIRHIQSRHHKGSKYNSSSYTYRSKFFRPKTRSALRQSEANAIAAYFSNPDVVTIEAQNPSDPAQKASAEIMQELVSYRLDNRLGNGIPWFLVTLGALHSAWVMGVVISKQYWQYEEVEEIDYEPVMMNGRILVGPDGDPIIREVKNTRKVKDRPWVELRPIENVRIHPASDWLDPINSSPFIVDMVPMFVIDLKRKMSEVDEKTRQPKWTYLTDEQILSATKQTYDTTRQEREAPRTDKYDPSMSKDLRSYDIVWIHENIFRMNGHDINFKTLGTEFLLTQPKPLELVYHHKIRPYVLGTCIIEPHKVYPPGIGELGDEIQKEINENANQRADNVKLALNKRYLVKRGSQVDIRSLVRNVAGGATMVGSIGGPKGPDVFPLEFGDVTSSAFQEQDRLNADFDEVVGVFSTSSINTNRRMGETVGGMSMLRGGVNMIKEGELKIFAETWMEPTLRQIIKLEQTYENDQIILSIAAERAQIFQKYGINGMTDDLLRNELTIKVNVGMGATDPMLKIQNFHMGIRILNEAMASGMGMYDLIELGKEVFGRLGYKDALRFFQNQGNGPDPEKQQLMQLVQDLQAQIGDKNMDRQVKMFLAKLKEGGQDKRKAADLDTRIIEKHMDLLNPVVGEKKPTSGGNGKAKNAA